MDDITPEKDQNGPSLLSLLLSPLTGKKRREERQVVSRSEKSWKRPGS